MVAKQDSMQVDPAGTSLRTALVAVSGLALGMVLLF